MCQRRKNGARPLELATNGICRENLEQHAAVCTSITGDSNVLITAALVYCANLPASEKPLPATALSLRAYHFDPCFLWTSSTARAAIVAWAQHAFIVQLATTIQPFKRLPVDCAGDILEFFGLEMTPEGSERIAKYSSSPEACAWVYAVVAAAVAVGPTKSVHGV